MDSLYIAYNDECDSTRANHVRKQLLGSKRYLVEGYMPFTTWSKTKLGTSTEQIKTSIEEGFERSDATLVLIGPDAATNPWIRYAIELTYNAQKPMLAMFINELKDEHGITNECDEAPCAGINIAEQFVRSGAIVAAILCLQGQVRSVGEFELSALAGDNSFLCPDGQSLTPPC